MWNKLCKGIEYGKLIRIWRFFRKQEHNLWELNNFVILVLKFFDIV